MWKRGVLMSRDIRSVGEGVCPPGRPRDKFLITFVTFHCGYARKAYRKATKVLERLFPMAHGKLLVH